MHELARRSKQARGSIAVAVSLNEALGWLLEALPILGPRRVSLLDRRRPVPIFTDGACEEVRGESVVTCGAVLVVDADMRYFGCTVPTHVAASWCRRASWQVIGQADFFQCWAIGSSCRPSLLFISPPSLIWYRVQVLSGHPSLSLSSHSSSCQTVVGSESGAEHHSKFWWCSNSDLL